VAPGPLNYENLRKEYIMGGLNEGILTNPKYKDDPAVLRLVEDILRGDVVKIDPMETDIEKLKKQIKKMHENGMLSDGDLVKLAMDRGSQARAAAANEYIMQLEDKPKPKPAEPPKAPKPEQPKPKGDVITAPIKILKPLPPEVGKQFSQLRAGLVLQLDEATARNVVRAYARGGAVATWESKKTRDQIPVRLGGPDPEKQIQKLLQMTRPIHDYNEKMATVLEKRITDQIRSGTEPGVIGQGIKESLSYLLKNPVQVTIKNPDGTPKLDEFGFPVTRTYSPEAYANMLARTIPYTLRNQGYIDHYQAMGIADGWIWVCAEDELSCEPCKDKHGIQYKFGDPTPSLHPFCRCRVKIHISEEVQKGWTVVQGPEQQKPKEQPKAEQPKPKAEEPKPEGAERAWIDWTTNLDLPVVEKLISDDMEQPVRTKQVTDDFHMPGIEAGIDDKGVWIKEGISQEQQTHALVGVYGEHLAKRPGGMETFLGNDVQYAEYLSIDASDDLTKVYRHVNVAVQAGEIVDLDGVQKIIRDRWDQVVKQENWVDSKVAQAVKTQKRPPGISSPMDDMTRGNLWREIKKKDKDLHDLLKTQTKSTGWKSMIYTKEDGTKVQVNLDKFADENSVEMMDWLIDYCKARNIEFGYDTFIQDTLTLVSREWYDNAKESNFTAMYRAYDISAKLGSLLEGMHMNPGMVKDLTPTLYEMVTKQISGGKLGQPIQKILTYTGTLEVDQIANLSAGTVFEFHPMTNYDQMVKEVKKVFPFAHKGSLKGAYGTFQGANSLQRTKITIRGSEANTPHGRSTLVHEFAHGQDWMLSSRKRTAHSIPELKSVFPQLSESEINYIYSTELKDTMCQVRHALVMKDDRLLNYTPGEAKTETQRTSQYLMGERDEGTPAITDYIGYRQETLNKMEAAIKSGRYTAPGGKKVENLDDLESALDLKLAQYYTDLEHIEYYELGLTFDQHQKALTLLEEELPRFKESQMTSTVKDSKPLTIYNFHAWAEKGFVAPIDEQVKGDIIEMHKLKWIQKVETHAWSEDLSWSRTPTERWAVFIQSLYIDPKRTAEIAPKAYAALLENLKKGLYNQILKTLLGFGPAL
jgi:hypothetical protein